MSKIRVYELARKFKLTNKALLSTIANLGIDVSSHMSSLDDLVVEKLEFVLFRKNGLSVKDIKQKNIDKLESNLDTPIKSSFQHHEAEICCCPGCKNIINLGLLSPRFILVDLAKELNCEFKEIFEQTKQLGFSDKVENGGITETEIKLLRTINTAKTVKKISDDLKIDSTRLIQTSKNMGFKKIDENQNLDRSKIIQLVIRYIKENANKKNNNNDIVNNRGEENDSDPIKGHRFILDGSNICQAYFQEKNKFSIRILLSIVCEILKRGGSFISMFDANIRYKIEEKKQDEIKHFKTLTRSWPDRFCLSTGRIPADDFILSRANETGDSIISNDNFINYESKYKWISQPRRLIKGKIMGDKISIPHLNLSIPVYKRIGNAINIIRANLS
jgi:hypothetical protein